MNRNLWKRGALGAVLLALSSHAAAHSLGQEGGFLSGIAHPFLGLDHLLAMLAVGVWAAQLGGRAVWSLPLSFVALMLLAAVAALAGVPLPMVESAIAASVLVLGLFIVFARQASVLSGVVLVGTFALFHGHAHGTEIVGAAWRYIPGFVLATAVLHAAGLALGSVLADRDQWRYALGGLIATSGAWMLAMR